MRDHRVVGKRLAWTSAIGAGAVGLAIACGSSSSDEAPICVDVARACAPLYEPTYDALFLRTFNPSCGVAGSTCHQSGGAGAARGLAFDTPDRAFGVLTDASRSWRFVDPGNPECSKVVYKISAHDSTIVMPPGRPLSPAEQCGIVSWIAKGAPR